MIETSSLYKALVVVGYALSSIGIMFVNKIILTANKFPSSIFLAASQMCITFVVLLSFSLCGFVKVPKPSQTLILRIIPFSCIYAVDLAAVFCIATYIEFFHIIWRTIFLWKTP
ncbi:hypothetical protein ECG_06311 [Echinococcus granulosus]|nr:hypothetical protein ECG_06311 [Echinococcus granulosus]